MNFSWVDIIIIFVVARAVSRVSKTGFVAELFNVFGIVCATFVTLHYYVICADFSLKYLLMPDTIHRLFAYGMSAFLIVFLFVLIREGWMIILKMELHPKIDKIGAMVCSLIRAYLVCGLVFLAFYIPRHDNLTKAAEGSFSKPFLKYASFSVYQSIFNRSIEAHFKKETINQDLIKLLEEKDDKKTKSEKKNAE